MFNNTMQNNSNKSSAQLKSIIFSAPLTRMENVKQAKSDCKISNLAIAKTLFLILTLQMSNKYSAHMSFVWN